MRTFYYKFVKDANLLSQSNIFEKAREREREREREMQTPVMRGH
jgi:hypothetical protein